MNCLKCYKEVAAAVCPHCGFSHTGGALLLEPLPEAACQFPVAVQLSKQPTASELWSLVQYAIMGQKKACQILADYYFSKVEKDRLLEIRRDISEYQIAKQVSVDITRAAYWVKMLKPLKGDFSPGQKYLLALEMMLDKAAPKRCFRYLKESAEEGFLPAIKFLIVCMETGWCCEKNVAAARELESKLRRQNIL